MSREVDLRKRWKNTPDQGAVRFFARDISEQLIGNRIKLSIARMRTNWPNLPPDSCFSRSSRIVYPKFHEILRSSSIQLRKRSRNYSAKVSFSEFGPFKPSRLISAEAVYTNSDPEHLLQVILNLSNREVSGITIYEHLGHNPSIDSTLRMTWNTSRVATRHHDDNTLLEKLGIGSKDFTPAYCIALMGVMLNPKLIDATTPEEMFDSIRTGFTNTQRYL